MEPVKTIHYANTNEVLLDISSQPPSDLSRHIEVIGAGFSRTATVSFTLALQILLKGHVCHAGSASLMREEAFIKKWIQALDTTNSRETTKKILKDLLAGYVAVTDSPSYQFAGELAEVFPDAKVIVTTRDPERWWESFSELMKTVLPGWVRVVFLSKPTLRWFGKWSDAMTNRAEVIYGPGQNKVDGPEFLERHYAYLKREVPKERLFFFDVKQGWGPLCEILNVPIPDEPFPHANDRLAVEAAFKGLIKDAMMRWLELLLVPAMVVGAYFYMTQR
ncbi:hypothetical protein BKA65DRAFT_514752 [Rhexocercosporidium sp. MPI-PUGE-AT-0058]|nr:hypothetical protein BKA65DRAFT_514752 [Rhexocercosporidium sp. MPI-PUGE-AT-0058]